MCACVATALLGAVAVSASSARTSSVTTQPPSALLYWAAVQSGSGGSTVRCASSRTFIRAHSAASALYKSGSLQSHWAQSDSQSPPSCIVLLLLLLLLLILVSYFSQYCVTFKLSESENKVATATATATTTQFEIDHCCCCCCCCSPFFAHWTWFNPIINVLSILYSCGFLLISLLLLSTLSICLLRFGCIHSWSRRRRLSSYSSSRSCAPVISRSLSSIGGQTELDDWYSSPCRVHQKKKKKKWHPFI